MEISNWYPMSPDKGPPLPAFLGIYWPWYTTGGETSADLEITDLTVSPAETNPGSLVIISCTATNISGAAGSFTVTLGGDFAKTTRITLQPGASTSVGWSVTAPAESGTYHVSVDGLNGQFVVIAP
ncbi:MAG: CARDB domain-containing protein [Dehalococcoidales bacterium]|nr:CARDB domain-containing protein [Dehalococcoidales bacterium]